MQKNCQGYFFFPTKPLWSWIFFFVLSFPLPGLIPLPEVLTPGSLLENMACIKGFRVRDEQVSCGLFLQEEKRRSQLSYHNRWVCFKNLSLFSGREEINVGRAPCKKRGNFLSKGSMCTLGNLTRSCNSVHSSCSNSLIFFSSGLLLCVPLSTLEDKAETPSGPFILSGLPRFEPSDDRAVGQAWQEYCTSPRNERPERAAHERKSTPNN